MGIINRILVMMIMKLMIMNIILIKVMMMMVMIGMVIMMMMMMMVMMGMVILMMVMMIGMVILMMMMMMMVILMMMMMVILMIMMIEMVIVRMMMPMTSHATHHTKAKCQHKKPGSNTASLPLPFSEHTPRPSWETETINKHRANQTADRHGDAMATAESLRSCELGEAASESSDWNRYTLIGSKSDISRRETRGGGEGRNAITRHLDPGANEESRFWI